MHRRTLGLTEIVGPETDATEHHATEQQDRIPRRAAIAHGWRANEEGDEDWNQRDDLTPATLSYTPPCEAHQMLHAPVRTRPM